MIGVDLGGTWTKVGLVNQSGKILHKVILETNLQSGFISVVNRIADAILSMIPTVQEVSIIGIGSPGTIDHIENKIIFSPNFQNWINVPIGSVLSTLTGLPVVLENDAKAAAYGEKWFGAGQGISNFFVLTLGTGVGGGAVVDGIILKGGQGFGGELGHICVFPDGNQCGCGSKGCLETYASKSGLTNTAKKLYYLYPTSPVFDPTNPKKVSIKEIFLQYLKTDPLSLLLVDQMIKALGIGIGSLVNILNPSKVILSGGISRSMPMFIPRISEIAKHHTMMSMRNTYEIIVSTIFEDAGILGAASMAMEEYRSNQSRKGLSDIPIKTIDY